jgi:hypothetical protein
MGAHARHGVLGVALRAFTHRADQQADTDRRYQAVQGDLDIHPVIMTPLRVWACLR